MIRIVPLNVGMFDALPKQTCMYRMYREVTYEAPCIMWYLAGTRNNIIVDLGPPDPKQVSETRGFAMHRSTEQEIPRALESAGVHPDDIKIVIVTHLHWDHAWGFHHFKNARFIIQSDEVKYAIAPFSCHRLLYYDPGLGKPPFVNYLDRIITIHGDYEVEEGVKAVSIPSHSPGFQGILVSTEKGRYFIAGDAVGLYECWETTPHVPSGIFNSLEDYYRSMVRIEQMADYVLPGHDPRVFDQPSYP
jgi:N-acyl homoserine lactone hydrolase